jgi:hypothetical protein
MADPIENFNLVEGVNLDDSSFTETEIIAAQSIIRQYISDNYEDIDFSELSSLNDILIRPFAQIFLILKKLIEEFSKTNTVYSALSIGGASSDNIIDGLLSNFNIKRRQGNVSTGFAKISLTNFTESFSIDESVKFKTNNDLIFYPSNSFTASTSPTTASQLKIYSDNTNTQKFVIVPFIAENSGSQYNIEQYTTLNILSERIGIISANAFSKFSGGQNKESNEEVINRIIPALSTRNLASPLAIEQTLRDNFPEIQQISIHGVNSELMSRNSHNIFGIKAGSFCDIYVKTSSFVEEFFEQNLVAQKITQSIINIDNSLAQHAGKYLLKLSRNELPGNYRITRVFSKELELTTLSSFNITEVRRKFNKYSNNNTVDNYIFTTQESTYSSYSYQEIIFEGSGQLSDTMSVTVFAEMLPSIQRIQEFVNQPGAQSALIDTLVKACVPCFISTSEITVRTKLGSTTSDEVQNRIIDYINSINPRKEEIRIDKIISSIMQDKNILSVNTPIMIQAEILAPDINFSTTKISSESVLSIPKNIALGYSRDNIGFFARKSGIPVTLIEI